MGKRWVGGDTWVLGMNGPNGGLCNGVLSFYIYNK